MDDYSYGYQEGFDAGYDNASEFYERKIDEMQDRINSLMEELNDYRRMYG